MHAFRTGKVILSKVGTAASFGFGLNAGARYSDSQSRHHILIEEARALALPRVDQSDDEDRGLDVDKSDLLMGYSCFRSTSSSSSHVALTDYSTASPTPDDVVEVNRFIKTKSRASKKCDQLRSSLPCARSSHITTPNSGSDERGAHIRDKKADCSKGAVFHRRACSQSIPQGLVAPKNQAGNPDIRIDHNHKSSLLPTPKTQVSSICHVPDDIDKGSAKTSSISRNDELSSVGIVESNWKQYQYQSDPQGLHGEQSMEIITWNSLLEKYQCSICADVLAVPVITSCQHGYCGICFHELSQAHHDIYPIDCPNCREPLQRGEQPLDIRRDARIAEQVAIFVAQQSNIRGKGFGNSEWEGQYKDWLERREKYFVSKLKSSGTQQDTQANESISTVESDLEAELDDLSSWQSAPIISENDNEGGDFNNGVVIIVGVALAAWCCFLMAKSSRMQPPRVHRSLLQELAVSLPGLWR